MKIAVFSRWGRSLAVLVKRLDLELRDLLALVAVVGIGGGLYMVYPPAGFIAVGVLALAAVVGAPTGGGEK